MRVDAYGSCITPVSDGPSSQGGIHMWAGQRTVVFAFIMGIGFSGIWFLDLGAVMAQTTIQTSGGFLEQDDAIPRTRWTNSQIQSFVPVDRKKFTFPAPYNTEAFRLTTATDCGGRDCVRYVGYSY